MTQPSVRRTLPWIVAGTLFMEQLDATILNTAVPTIAASLEVAPLTMKAVVASYLVGLAVVMPTSAWMADRFGTRRVFAAALALFVLASALCGLATNVPTMVAARLLQGAGAALTMPVGRLMIVRTFAKSELLATMNIVIIPGLVGALLGPALGGLIVGALSWRAIFFVNLPLGLAALWWVHRELPDYRSAARRPFDLSGLLLFSAATLLAAWLLGVFGDPATAGGTAALWSLAAALLVVYGWHARRTPHPLLDLALFKVRTFRVAVAGGFVARLGLGALPFLLPLLFQLGLGLPPWQAGLLMMPMAAGAMAMKALAPHLLARLGYRSVLTLNTVAIGLATLLFSAVGTGTPLVLVAALGFVQGLVSSLQFSSLNSIAYADIGAAGSSMASTIASTLQQLSMTFGLALGSILTGWALGGGGAEPAAWVEAVQRALAMLAALTLVSSLSFLALRPGDGASVAGTTALRRAP